MGSEDGIWGVDGSGEVKGKLKIVPRSGSGGRLTVWVDAEAFKKKWQAKQGAKKGVDGARIKVLKKPVDQEVLTKDQFEVL